MVAAVHVAVVFQSQRMAAFFCEITVARFAPYVSGQYGVEYVDEKIAYVVSDPTEKYVAQETPPCVGKYAPWCKPGVFGPFSGA